MYNWNPTNLKTLVLERNVKIVELSQATGVSATTLNNCLNGLKAPSVATLMALAEYFEVSLDYLAGRDDEKYNEVRSLVGSLFELYHNDKTDVEGEIAQKPVYTPQNIPQDKLLENKGLSTRSYRGLMRSGINDMDQLLRVAQSGGLMSVHNIGKVSVREILTMIKENTGEDCFALYDLGSISKG